MIIYNSKLAKLLPEKFLAITLGFFIFTVLSKEEVDAAPDFINHEEIHTWQWLELGALTSIFVAMIFALTGVVGWSWMWLVPIFLLTYYLWYGLEYIIMLLWWNRKARTVGGCKKLCRIIYRNISFEKEAYENESNLSYLSEWSILKTFTYIGKPNFS